MIVRLYCWIVVLSGLHFSALAAGQPDHLPQQPQHRNQVLVQYQPGVTARERRAIRHKLGMQLIQQTRRSAVATGQGVLESCRLSRQQNMQRVLLRLNRDARVLHAEPDWVNHFVAIANDEYITAGWLWNLYGNNSSPASLYGTQASESWLQGHTGASDIVIGIIDEGVQIDHPDLAPNIWNNPYDQPDGIDNDGNGYVDDVNGWDMFHGDNTVYDGGVDGTLDRHGTHIAGIIGARGGNRIGVAGINWQVTLIPCKIGEGESSTLSAIECLDYFTDLKRRHGLNIVATNNAWGGGGYSATLEAAINRAGDADILFVTASGNSGSNNDVTPYYPANYTCLNPAALRPYDCVIAVGSMNSVGTLSSFSNYGATTVDIAAPGTAIFSTVPPGQYDTLNGTSMAAPHVSGSIALYAASKRDPLTGQLPSAEVIRRAILDGATLNPNLNGKVTAGRQLDVSGALNQ